MTVELIRIYVFSVQLQMFSSAGVGVPLDRTFSASTAVLRFEIAVARIGSTESTFTAAKHVLVVISAKQRAEISLFNKEHDAVARADPAAAKADFVAVIEVTELVTPAELSALFEPLAATTGGSQNPLFLCLRIKSEIATIENV